MVSDGQLRVSGELLDCSSYIVEVGAFRRACDTASDGSVDKAEEEEEDEDGETYRFGFAVHTDEVEEG